MIMLTTDCSSTSWKNL